MSTLTRRQLFSSLLRTTGELRERETSRASTALSSRALASSAVDDVLVVVVLYGGFDGLTAVPPLGDPSYRLARPTIAVPPSSALPLDSLFGLHPALSPLMASWSSRQLAIVQAVGTPYPTRSHFQSQQDLGQAAPGTSLASGWLNRALSELGTTGPLTAVQVGNSVLTPSLIGPAPATTLWEVGDFSLVGAQWAGPVLASTISSLYSNVNSSTSVTALDTLAACGALGGLQSVAYAPANGATYPGGGLGSSLSGVAQLIKANVGVRLAAVEYGDWDFHAGLGQVGSGAMTAMLAELAQSLAAFATDLGNELSRVTVVTVSEFGRRVDENGSQGVDHGHGNAMFVLGGNVKGAKVYGTWPTLQTDALNEGALAGTTDYRSVLAELLAPVVGLSSLSSVFPGYSPQFLGII